jgi:hypothetical protein
MHEVLRASSNRKTASRAELQAPKVGACVSPAPLSALSKYRPFAPPSLQRCSLRSCRLSGWLQIIRKSRHSIANYVLASFEGSCTSNLFCETILQTTVMPTPTLFLRTSRPKKTRISSEMSHSIAGDLLVTIRVLSPSVQLCWG